MKRVRASVILCSILGVLLLFRLFVWREEYGETKGWQFDTLFYTSYLIRLYEDVHGRLPENTDEALVWWQTQFGPGRDRRVDPYLMDVMGKNPCKRSIPTLVKREGNHWYLKMDSFGEVLADDGNRYLLKEMGRLDPDSSNPPF